MTRRNGTSASARRRRDQVTAYAKAVVNGRILANRLVQSAGERHLRDQERKDLVWDVEASERAIAFYPDVLRIDGGKPFVLSPHQAFQMGSLYGWKRLDGSLRFEIAYVECSKGDGKTPQGAGFILRRTSAEGQVRAECYVAATHKDQAMIAFRDCAAMRKASPALASRLKPSGTGVLIWNLAHEESGSFCRPVASEDGQSGRRVFGALIDELHEHRSSTVLDMMVAGTKGRKNALILIITNSGFDRQSVCWREHEYSVKVLRGALEDDSRFAFIAGLDPCAAHAEEGQEFPVEGCPDCDDWRDERVWPKACPNLGVTITHDYLRRQVRLAMGMPAMENVVKRLNFCIWTESANRAISIEVWDRNARLVPLEELRGQEAYLGADLGMTDDLCSVAAMFPRGEMPELLTPPLLDAGEDARAEYERRWAELAAQVEPWPLHWWAWMPEEAFRKRVQLGQQPWELWRQQGLVEVTPGAMTDYGYIRHRIASLAEQIVIRELGIDRWNASYLITQLQEDGLQVVLVGQGYESMSAPTKAYLAMLKAGRFAHGGQAMARWQATNLEVRSDAAGNQKPDKEKSGDKIDMQAAAINALARAMVRPTVDLSGELCLGVY
jgi:phage terminase large subunit-like protein